MERRPGSCPPQAEALSGEVGGLHESPMPRALSNSYPQTFSDDHEGGDFLASRTCPPRSSPIKSGLVDLACSTKVPSHRSPCLA
jgi:hypothetical protein